MASSEQQDVPVAIIGAGISGLVLALALQQRGILYHIYEQASGYSELGAGLNFGPAGVKALKASSQAAYEAMMSVRTAPHPSRDDYYFTYTDGTRSFELVTDGGKGGVRRSLWIDRMAKHIPEGNITFSKRVASIRDHNSGPVILDFADASIASASAVVGCDGIKSAVRSHILGSDHPATSASFAHVIAYRSIMSKDDARRVMNPALADAAHFRTGKGISYVSYPITGGQHNSLGIFISHAGPWEHFPSVSAKSSKTELLERVGDDDYFKEVAGLLADELDVWALYDLADDPPPTYAKDRLAVIGDAAHASTPNLGAGAGTSIEDAVILADLIQEVYTRPHAGQRAVLYKALPTAFAVYSDARVKRGQWLVATSRFIGRLNMQEPVDGKPWTWGDYERETTENYHETWRGDVDQMISKVKGDYGTRLGSTVGSAMSR